MTFNVVPPGSCPSAGHNAIYLVTDRWDDYFTFETQYGLVVFDSEGTRNNIGDVKIGQFEMAVGQRRPNVPSHFTELDDTFFSLGQDDHYYDNLNKLGPSIRNTVLKGLRDVALDQELFDRALHEQVTLTSLLRSLRRATVRGQFHRLATGGARLTPYNFSYAVAPTSADAGEPMTLSFVVTPESVPPTNIHVLIGRNGVGKTTTLNNMTSAIVRSDSPQSHAGVFSTEAPNETPGNPFTSLVSVSFSAFDQFDPRLVRTESSDHIQYSYIGLKDTSLIDEASPPPPKSLDALAAEFSKSVLSCRAGARAPRWRRALEMLETDPIFRDAEVTALANDERSSDTLASDSAALFDSLSSGHKIVLLTITRIVETVDEKTLVLFDEPEAHLHPPLLSALVRALSDLLTNRNGVAIIATHSPVVLQEVPRKCVWAIRRTGRHVIAERPDLETFGENVGTLTREIFGLEVTESGFNKMLQEAVREESSFERVLARFDNELGGEARAIVRALFSAKEQ